MTQLMEAYIPRQSRQGQDSLSTDGNMADYNQMLQAAQANIPLEGASYLPDLQNHWSPTPRNMVANHQLSGATYPLELLGDYAVAPGLDYNTLVSNASLNDLSQPLVTIPGSYIDPVDSTGSRPPQGKLERSASWAYPASSIPETPRMPTLNQRHSAPASASQGTSPSQRTKTNHRRASHNLVEKRYRINLNSKFRKLEEVVVKGTEPYTTQSPNTSTGRHHQSPKASIIDRALGYIENLQGEIDVLKGKLDLMEKPSGEEGVLDLQTLQVSRDATVKS